MNPIMDESRKTRWVKLTAARTLVCDVAHFAQRVPLFPVERSFDLAEVAARREAPPRPREERPQSDGEHQRPDQRPQEAGQDVEPEPQKQGSQQGAEQGLATGGAGFVPVAGEVIDGRHRRTFPASPLRARPGQPMAAAAAIQGPGAASPMTSD